MTQSDVVRDFEASLRHTTKPRTHSASYDAIIFSHRGSPEGSPGKPHSMRLIDRDTPQWSMAPICCSRGVTDLTSLFDDILNAGCVFLSSVLQLISDAEQHSSIVRCCRTTNCTQALSKSLRLQGIEVDCADNLNSNPRHATNDVQTWTIEAER